MNFESADSESFVSAANEDAGASQIVKFLC